MKKLNRRHKGVLLRRSTKAMKRARRLKEVLRNAKIAPKVYRRFTSSRSVSLYRDGKFEEGFVLSDGFDPPSQLSLNNNYENTAEFLQHVRGRLSLNLNRFFSSGRPRNSRTNEILSYYDFTKIDLITIPVALILASEYDCLRRIIPFTLRAIDIEKWRPQVRDMLLGIGFLEMVGVDQAGPSLLISTDFRVLRFISGSKADGEQVDNLLTRLGVPEALDNPAIYDAIIEALVNTRHHAYPKGRKFPKPHFAGWWLTAMVDYDERSIRISAFDRGLGIPATLNTWTRYSVFQRGWRRLFRNEPDLDDTRADGTVIRMAMAVGRSSTGHAYRGKGLPAMEAAVDLCREGSITIYSRCGRYHKAKGQRPIATNGTTPVGGTLVTWDLRF